MAACGTLAMPERARLAKAGRERPWPSELDGFEAGICAGNQWLFFDTERASLRRVLMLTEGALDAKEPENDLLDEERHRELHIVNFITCGESYRLSIQPRLMQ